MLTEKNDFSRYGKAFQEGLVQLILEDRAFADQITEVLDINFLELEYLRVFVSKLMRYRHKYGNHPSSQALLTIFKTEDIGDEVAEKQLFEFCNRIEVNEITDGEYIKEVSLEFCRK